MMRYAALLSLIIFTALASFAQIDGLEEPEEWRTFSPKGEEFSVEAPVELNKIKFAGKKDDVINQYVNRLNDNFYFVFSENRNGRVEISLALGFIRDYQKKGDIVSFGKIKGVKFAFTDNEGFYHRAIYVESDSRTYLFHVASGDRDDNAAKRFLRNLKLKDRPLSGAGTDYDETAAGKPEESTGNINMPPMGMGEAIGGGPGPPLNPPRRPLRIISKMPARYTDIARIYNVNGTITLRVEFLADGTIGKVTTITRLPFGLTNQSVAAARAITFEPELIDGVPQTKTKVIQYSFRIY
jgi:hypothetical protein